MPFFGRGRFKPKHPLFSRQLVDVLGRQAIAHVLDVGANEGQFGQELFWAGYGGSIVSFEPQPGVHGALARAAQARKGWRVAPPMGLGAAKGTLTLNSYSRSDMSSFLPATRMTGDAQPDLALAERVEVPVHTLDELAAEFIPETSRTLLKLDVQGFEGEVLTGAAATLPRLAGVLVEVSAAPLYEGQPNYLDILNRLETAGFRLWLLSHGYYSKKVGRQLDFDVLMLNEKLGR